MGVRRRRILTFMKYLSISKLLLAVIFVAAISASVLAQAKSASSFRSITVVTSPGTKLWIDGVYYGKADATGKLTVNTVAAGGHSLRFRADGFKERTQPLTAVQRGEIRVEMVKTTDPAELAFQEAERLLSVDRDKAADAYRKAIELKSAFPDAFVALARVLTELGDIEEAETAIASARKLRPGFAEASAVLGRIHKEGGEEEKAIAAFKRAITEGKSFQPEAYTGLGLLYKERAEGFAGSGDFEKEDLNYLEAAKNLKVALKQLSGAPDTIVIYQLLGLIYERQKKYTEAIAVYEEFLRIFPNSSEATAVRSFIVQLRKDMNTPQ